MRDCLLEQLDDLPPAPEGRAVGCWNGTELEIDPSEDVSSRVGLQTASIIGVGLLLVGFTV